MTDEERVCRQCAIVKRDLRDMFLNMQMTALGEPAKDGGKSWRQLRDLAEICEHLETVQRVLGQ